MHSHCGRCKLSINEPAETSGGEVTFCSESQTLRKRLRSSFVSTQSKNWSSWHSAPENVTEILREKSFSRSRLQNAVSNTIWDRIWFNTSTSHIQLHDLDQIPDVVQLCQSDVALPKRLVRERKTKRNLPGSFWGASVTASASATNFANFTTQAQQRRPDVQSDNVSEKVQILRFEAHTKAITSSLEWNTTGHHSLQNSAKWSNHEKDPCCRKRAPTFSDYENNALAASVSQASKTNPWHSLETATLNASGRG